MQKVKVKQMYTSRGNVASEQYIIYTPEGTYFQSYDSIIAFQPYGEKLVLDKRYWNYSATTGKYRIKFLEEGETRNS